MKPIDYYDNLNENSNDEIKEMIATTKYDLLLLDSNFRDIICAALNHQLHFNVYFTGRTWERTRIFRNRND